jgi:hypothetical protein
MPLVTSAHIVAQAHAAAFFVDASGGIAMVTHSKTPQRAVVFAALLLAVAACATTKIETDYYEPFSFAGHDTFAWISEHPMVVHSVDVSPFAEARIQQSIINALQQKGIRYVADPTDAKLLIGFGVGSKEKISVTSAPYPGPYWGGYPWIGTYYQSVDVHQYAQGRLTIDIFDTEEKLPIWHGSATKNIDLDDELTGKGTAHDPVDAILAGFPPGAWTK